MTKTHARPGPIDLCGSEHRFYRRPYKNLKTDERRYRVARQAKNQCLAPRGEIEWLTRLHEQAPKMHLGQLRPAAALSDRGLPLRPHRWSRRRRCPARRLRELRLSAMASSAPRPARSPLPRPPKRRDETESIGVADLAGSPVAGRGSTSSLPVESTLTRGLRVTGPGPHPAQPKPDLGGSSTSHRTPEPRSRPPRSTPIGRMLSPAFHCDRR